MEIRFYNEIYGLVYIVFNIYLNIFRIRTALQFDLNGKATKVKKGLQKRNSKCEKENNKSHLLYLLNYRIAVHMRMQVYHWSLLTYVQSVEIWMLFGYSGCECCSDLLV